LTWGYTVWYTDYSSFTIRLLYPLTKIYALHARTDSLHKLSDVYLILHGYNLLPNTKIKMKLTESQKNKIAITGLSIIFFPFAFFGIAMAYDNFILQMMENSLTQNIQTVNSSQKACNSSYQILLKYKQDNNLKLQGTGSPCPLTPATS
jgi:hypothetical protein